MDEFDRMIAVICEIYGVDRAIVVTESKNNRPAEHRLMAMWTARNHLHMSWTAIAEKFGRTHPTCIRNCYRFTVRLREDTELSQRLETLIDRLG